MSFKHSVPPPPTVLHKTAIVPITIEENPAFSITRFGPVLITTLRTMITLSGIDLSIDTSNAIIREHGRVASFMIFGAPLELPSAAIRKRADEATKASQEGFICTANLVLTTGLIGSGTLMTLLSLEKLSPKKYKHQTTVKSAELATSWITEHLKGSAEFQRRLTLAAQPLIRYALKP